MTRSGWRPGVVLLTAALISIGAVAQAATTEMHVQIGSTFTGEIATPGADTVHAYFNAGQGTTVRVATRAARGSTLQPTVTLKDSSGIALAPGKNLRLGWLPVANETQLYTIPADGNYLLEIGGTSGSGMFQASLSGTLPAGMQEATIAGQVTDNLTGAGLPGVTVRVGPFLLVTDATGAYSGRLPVGTYTVTYDIAGYQTSTQTVNLPAGGASGVNVALIPIMPTSITAGVTGTATPGATLNGTLTLDLPANVTVNSVLWTQEEGVPAVITGADTNAPTITLGTVDLYKQALIHHLVEPLVTQDQLPPNVPIPAHGAFGGLQDRFQIVPVNPLAAEETGLVVLEVTVDTSAGIFTQEVEVHTELPWGWAPGLRNVPVGETVLLQAKDQGAGWVYDWTLTPPPGSSATLVDATMQHPEFTPDVPGLYVVDVTDATDGPVQMEVYAGTWRGIVVGQDANNRPVSDPACTVCHKSFAPDLFTPWAQTGHAEIFTNMLDTNRRYGSNCFPCHTVGFEKGGADSAADWPSFLTGGLLGNPGDNWTTMLSAYPESAQLSNIQCENCHGPQSAGTGLDNDAHGWNAPLEEPRVDISSDVCAVCHGEPLRHARFQQWQLSPHANYELAISRGGSGSCARCHTGNGFLKWLPILLDDDPTTDPTASITVDWATDETHPQTCATCHDPHNIGTTSGSNPNATVRVSGDTPPLIGGFTATNVGRGAICITCHNSRRGLRNDDVFAGLSLSDKTRAAHGSAQGDVLMGQNAFFAKVGARGSHSLLEDACVDCHMEATPPPAVLSYNQGGTNHTFRASPDICSECHSGLTADAVQGGVHGFLDELEGLIEGGIRKVMADQIALGNSIDLGGQRTITDISEVSEIQFTESRGRQAIIVTFTDTTVIGPTGVNSIDVVDPTGTVLDELYAFASDNLIKAGWNWTLFHNDGSFGVHNPFYAFEALVAARNALLPAPAQELLPPASWSGRRLLWDSVLRKTRR